MKMNDIDWKSGNVVYWDMESIDPNLPLTDQMSELKEDLAQVSFPDGLLIDVGWYPEFSEEGGFLVSVVRDENWDEPLMKERCFTIPELSSALNRAISIADQRHSRKL